MVHKRKHTVAVVANCLHMPYVFKPAFELFLVAVEKIHPDILVINGDGVDFAGISPHNKNKRVEVVFEEEEIAPTLGLIKAIEGVAGRRCEKVWLEGNHEKWYEGYYRDKIAETPRTWADALKLGKNWQVEMMDGKELPTMTLGKLLITHGSMIRAQSGWTARAELNARWRPVLIGHTHRLGSYYFTPAETGIIFDAYEGGCLADPYTSRRYMRKKPNWQFGFSVVSFAKDGWFEVVQKRISRLDGSAKYQMMLHEGVFTAT